MSRREKRLLLKEYAFSADLCKNILKGVHRALKPRLYLEIGVRSGDSLLLAGRNTIAVGVDPVSPQGAIFPESTHFFPLESDEFFKNVDITRYGRNVDLCFLDGMRHFEYALRDFINMEKYANNRTVAIFQSTYPVDEKSVSRERRQRFWLGDYYKVVMILKKYRPDLTLLNSRYTTNGMLFVTNLNPASTVLAEKYDEIVREYLPLTINDVKDGFDERWQVSMSKADIEAFIDNVMCRRYEMEFQNRIFMDGEHASALAKDYFASHKSTGNESPRVVERGIVLPYLLTSENILINRATSGLLDADGRYVEDSGMLPYAVNANMPDEIPHITKDVMYGGILFYHYGHFLIQSTTRLYYWIKLARKMPIVFTVNNSSEKIPTYITDFFVLLGIDLKDVILVDRHTRFDRIVCPRISSREYLDWNDDFILPFKTAAKDIAPLSCEKVFFTRKYLGNIAKCLGEKEIERIFNKNGFTSVAMEKLSLRRQIAVMKGAKVLAGLNGTAFHNVMFAEPGIKAIILNRNKETDSQFIMNEASRIDWRVVQVFRNPLPTAHPSGPFIVGITPHLRRFLKFAGLSDFSEKFAPEKYAREFYSLYMQLYSMERYYRELEMRGINRIMGADMLRMIGISRHSAMKLLLFAIYKLSFGNFRKKFKSMYLNLLKAYDTDAWDY